jgi:phosphoglycolate phosphatase-like HAD superfamily hydrolase
MALLNVNGAHLDVDLVIFDKDGTLIDLDVSWAAAGRRWLEETAAGDADTLHLLAGRLGFDTAAGRLVADGVMAAGTVDELERHTRLVLVEVGVDEATVDARVESARHAAAVASLDLDGLPLLGDVGSGFRRLVEVGVAVGIVTSDDRAVGEALVRAAGVTDLVTRIVGGDDPVGAKPSPDGILAVCESVGVAPTRALMVGDSTADLLAARNAGVAAFICVGASSPAAADADAIIASIDEIAVG